MEELFRKTQALRKMREDRKSKINTGINGKHSQNQNDYVKLKEDHLVIKGFFIKDSDLNNNIPLDKS